MSGLSGRRRGAVSAAVFLVQRPQVYCLTAETAMEFSVRLEVRLGSSKIDAFKRNDWPDGPWDPIGTHDLRTGAINEEMATSYTWGTCTSIPKIVVVFLLL